MKILSFGEIVLDIYPQKQTLGGAPMNFSAHAAQCGAESWLLSRVGKDERGKAALDEAASYGVKTDLITTHASKPTGACHVTLDEHAIPCYTLDAESAYDEIELPKNPKLLDGFDAFVYGTLTLRYERNRKTAEAILSAHRFSEVFTDINVRKPFFTKEALLCCLCHATIVKISDEELPCVLQTLELTAKDLLSAARLIAERFPQIRLVLITCGAEGSMAYDCRMGSLYSIQAPHVRVVSTVGAGDSFGAAFLCAYLLGKPIDDCLAAATERSAYVVGFEGAIP